MSSSVRSDGYTALQNVKNLKGEQLEFVFQLSKVLGLDERQAFDIYCGFLVRDFKGSRKDLKVIIIINNYSLFILLIV